MHDLFDTDDGSLPEIRIDFASNSSTVAGYGILARRGAIAGDNPSFWSIAHQAERPLESVENAAALVVAGEAESFHVVFRGIRAEGAVIPDLGVFVFPDQLALDYRMGSEWGPPELGALFLLVSELVALEPGASVSLWHDGAEGEARFLRIWDHWRAGQAT